MVGLEPGGGRVLASDALFPTMSSAADVPKAAVLWVMTGAGLPFLVVLAMGRGPARDSSNLTWAARSGIAF
ncbi:MAG: hypothetical protein ACLP62_12555, partial [Acidimicrobiales bacterium]